MLLLVVGQDLPAKRRPRSAAAPSAPCARALRAPGAVGRMLSGEVAMPVPDDGAARTLRRGYRAPRLSASAEALRAARLSQLTGSPGERPVPQNRGAGTSCPHGIALARTAGLRSIILTIRLVLPQELSLSAKVSEPFASSSLPACSAVEALSASGRQDPVTRPQGPDAAHL